MNLHVHNRRTHLKIDVFFLFIKLAWNLSSFYTDLTKQLFEPNIAMLN